MAAYRAHNADAIVALGGGAAIDVAKAMLLMIHHPGDLFDYEDGKPDAPPDRQGDPALHRRPHHRRHRQRGGPQHAWSPTTTARSRRSSSPRGCWRCGCSIDPDLTLGLPAGRHRRTGMDAVTHLVESYLAKDFHPMCDGIALEGMRIAARNLQPCVDYARHIAGGERT